MSYTYEFDYDINPKGRIFAMDKQRRPIQIYWGEDGNLTIDPNSYAGPAEIMEGRQEPGRPAGTKGREIPEKLIGELWEKDNSTAGGQGINPFAYRIGAVAMYRQTAKEIDTYRKILEVAADTMEGLFPLTAEAIRESLKKYER